MGLKKTYEATDSNGISWSELIKLASQSPASQTVIVQAHGGRMPRITKIVDDGSAIFVTITN